MTSVPLWRSGAVEVRPGGVENGRVALEYRQDVGPILDENKARQAHSSGWSAERLLKHVAHIPSVVLYVWMAEDGVDFFRLKGDEQTAWLMRKINDPDWQLVRASKPLQPYQKAPLGLTFSAADHASAERAA